MCPSPPPINHADFERVEGWLTSNGAIHGTMLEYSCRVGYRDSRTPCLPTRRTCHAGTWIGKKPSCGKSRSALPPPEIILGSTLLLIFCFNCSSFRLLREASDHQPRIHEISAGERVSRPLWGSLQLPFRLQDEGPRPPPVPRDGMLDAKRPARVYKGRPLWWVEPKDSVGVKIYLWH